MKKILFLIICLIVITIQSFRLIETNKRLAEVNQYQGYYIFMQCQPVSDYTTLGTVKKTGLTWTDKPREMFDILIKRTKKDYQQANGIIFDDIEMEHATAIMFKD